MIQTNFFDNLSVFTPEERYYEQCHKGDITPENDYIDSLSSKLLFPLEGGIEVRKHPAYLPEYVHSHNFLEMVCTIKGHAVHHIQGSEIIMKEGDMLFLPPGAYHSIAVFDRSLIINILVSETCLTKLTPGLTELDNPLSSFFGRMGNAAPCLLVRQGMDEEIGTLLELLYREQMKEGKSAYTLRLSLFSAIISRIMENNPDYREPIPGDKEQRRNAAMVGYIRSHLSTITLSSLADYFGFTREYTSHLIHDYTGWCYADLIRQLRVEKSLELLKNDSLSCKEIARALGFTSHEHFSRSFRRWMGMSPSEYRDKDAQGR